MRRAVTGPAGEDGRGVALVTGPGRPVAGWAGPVERVAGLAGPVPALPAAGHLLLCPPGVELVDGAEALVREMLTHDPDVDLAYFDSIDDSGPEPLACHRPGFSPDRLRAQQYLGEVLLVRGRVLVDHLADGGAIDLPPTHGQVRALADRGRVIAHLPRFLHRADRPASVVAPLGQPAADGGEPPTGSGRSRARPDPLVSVVMPTRGAERRIADRAVTLCLNAVDRMVTSTTYRPYEIVVVLTPGAPEELAARLQAVLDRHPPDRRPDLRLCRDGRRFNFSDVCNRGAVSARGDVLVFVNDDTEVRTPDWLDRLVERATRPEVGAVGARLLYGDGSIQHAGIWSRGGHPAHRYEGFRADHPGHLDSLTVAQNCLAVTGACLAVEAAKFDRAGGFCPEFPSSYNDVDLCLKLDALGHRTVVDPAVVLTHYEASSRDPRIEDWELALLHRRWRRLLIDDPYDNPNHIAPGADEFPPPDPAITLQRQRSGLAVPPARVWRRPEPMTDLIDLERSDRTATDREDRLHVL
jgi:GT2 family glycosyltransferase